MVNMNDLETLMLEFQGEIEIIAKEKYRLQGLWTEKLLRNNLDDNPQIAIDQQSFFVYFFIKAFPTLEIDDIRILALAGQFFANSVVLCDEVIDRASSGINIASVLAMQARQFESYHLLYQIFPPNTTFWQRFRGYLSQYTQACLEENDFSSGNRPWHEYSESIAIQSIKNKTGVAKTAIAGLVELAEDDTYLDSLNTIFIAVPPNR